MASESGGAAVEVASKVNLPSLPVKASLSPFLRDLLNANFNNLDDLAAAPVLLLQLQKERQANLDNYQKIKEKVVDRTASSVSHFHTLTSSLRRLSVKLEVVKQSNSPSFYGEQQAAHDVGSDHHAARISGKRTALLGDSLSDSEVRNALSEPEGAYFLQRRKLVKGLEALANEVAGVERVRLYAENVLKLERLVGDLEAAVEKIAGPGRPLKQAGGANLVRLARAVKCFQTTEAAVAEIGHRQWNRLVSAVDVRVDHVAAILRPAVIADHRAFLVSIGWPPNLAATSSGHDLKNPLLLMDEDQERRYSESFMTLAILQAVQQNRRERQLSQYKSSAQAEAVTLGTFAGGKWSQGSMTREPLWAVEELVAPIAARAEYHLVQWTQKPELVCALAYRMAQEYVDVIDEFLQPCIDAAKLVGYSAREEWVFSFVNLVSLYLQTHVLPGLANDVREEGGAGSAAAALWLHTVDQILAFDSRMKSLAVQPLGLFSGKSRDVEGGHDVDSLLGPLRQCISVFADREDWLAVWARVELEDTLDKLKAELLDGKAWVLRGTLHTLYGVGMEAFYGLAGQSGSNYVEFKAPSGADFVLSSMAAVTDRCRSLQIPNQQLFFLREAVNPIAKEYLQELLRRCQELEALTALAEESAMLTVAICVNAARYCECTLLNWGEDIFFLTLIMTEKPSDDVLTELDCSVFEEEIGRLKKFRLDWIGKLQSSLARGFEGRCREYFRNKKRWTESGKFFREVDFHKEHDTDIYVEVGQSISGNKNSNLQAWQIELLGKSMGNILDGVDISTSLVDALALLQNHLRALHMTFDNANFLELWCSLAVALDNLLFNSVVLGGAKFSVEGGWQFAADVQALFILFKPYCQRPSHFFKGLHDSVRLLTLHPEDAQALLQMASSLSGKGKYNTDMLLDSNKVLLELLRKYGIRKTVPSIAKRILYQRVF